MKKLSEKLIYLIINTNSLKHFTLSFLFAIKKHFCCFTGYPSTLMKKTSIACIFALLKTEENDSLQAITMMFVSLNQQKGRNAQIFNIK